MQVFIQSYVNIKVNELIKYNEFSFNKQKNSYLLILFYIVLISFTYINIKDFGIHIEEKFHRLNGLYWLNYVSGLLG